LNIFLVKTTDTSNIPYNHVTIIYQNMKLDCLSFNAQYSTET